MIKNREEIFSLLFGVGHDGRPHRSGRHRHLHWPLSVGPAALLGGTCLHHRVGGRGVGVDRYLEDEADPLPADVGVGEAGSLEAVDAHRLSGFGLGWIADSPHVEVAMAINLKWLFIMFAGCCLGCATITRRPDPYVAFLNSGYVMSQSCVENIGVEIIHQDGTVERHVADVTTQPIQRYADIESACRDGFSPAAACYYEDKLVKLSAPTCLRIYRREQDITKTGWK